MNDIMYALEANRTIMYLNLSWNQIRGTNLKINKEIMARLTSFILENRRLIHLDLCSINLQEEDLKRIGKTVSMSTSLLG